MDDATFQQLMQMWAGPQPAQPAQPYTSPSPYLNGGPSSFPTGLEYAEHPGIGYMGANMPPQAPVAEDGVPYNFYGGQPVDYQRPAVNMGLNAAASTEGQRFDTRQPGITEDGAGTLLGSPLELAHSQPAAPTNYDYGEANLEQGRNLDRQSFVGAYDDQRRAEAQKAVLDQYGPKDELGNPLMPLPYTGADAFIKPTKKEEQARHDRAIGLADQAAQLSSPIGPILGAAGAGRGLGEAYGAYDRGDYASMIEALTGAGMNASMILPGMNSAKAYTKDTLEALRAEKSPVYHDDGSLATVEFTDPIGLKSHQALLRSPSTTLFSGPGVPTGGDVGRMAKELEAQGVSGETLWGKVQQKLKDMQQALLPSHEEMGQRWAENVTLHEQRLDKGTGRLNQELPQATQSQEQQARDLRLEGSPHKNVFGLWDGDELTGSAIIGVDETGKRAYVNMLGNNTQTPFTPGEMKSLLSQLKERFPNVETIGGQRITGSRAGKDIDAQETTVKIPQKQQQPQAGPGAPPGFWKTVNPDYPNLSENGKINFKQSYAARSDPQNMQEVQQHYDTLTKTTKPDDFKTSLDTLRSNKAVDGETRDYLAKVSQYVRKDPESGHGNAMVEAYMKQSGGKMYQPVPVDSFYDAYKPVAQARRDEDRALYVKDRGKFDQHLQTYGRGSDAELGSGTPSLAKPWLVQDGMVSLSPYIPKMDVNPVTQPSAQTMAISNNLASKTGDVPKKPGGQPRFDYESIRPGISQLPYQEQLNIRRQIARKADNPNPNPRGRPPWKRKLVWKDE